MHPRSPWEELGDVHALAFAHDAGTEEVLREVLAGCADHEVRSGGAREAVAALRDGDAAVPRLLVVDLDTVGYVGGVLHELSAVCSSDTVVVALSSERSARLSREMFLCGVADHLVKPLEPETVGALLVQAVRRGHDGSVEGCLVGASGTGGSGTTTLVAAVALRAVRRGRRVSLVDLSRGFSTLAFLLDIDPPAGPADLAARGWLRGRVPAPLAAVADVVLDLPVSFGPMAHLSPSTSVVTDLARAPGRSALPDRGFAASGRALRRLSA